MRTIYPETVTPEYHAAGVALCAKLRRSLWPFRDEPAVAHTLARDEQPVASERRDATTESEAA